MTVSPFTFIFGYTIVFLIGVGLGVIIAGLLSDD